MPYLFSKFIWRIAWPTILRYFSVLLSHFYNNDQTRINCIFEFICFLLASKGVCSHIIILWASSPSIKYCHLFFHHPNDRIDIFATVEMISMHCHFLYDIYFPQRHNYFMIFQSFCTYFVLRKLIPCLP